MASLSSAVDGGASHLDPILIAMRDHGVVVSFFHAGSTDTPTLSGTPEIAVLHDNDFSQQPGLSRYPLLQRFIATCGGACTAAGYFLGGGAIGAIVGREGGEIGAKAMGALRDAGINRINELRVQAALDPEFGKALLSEMPKYPDRGAAALIALRARQWGLASGMAGDRQNDRHAN